MRKIVVGVDGSDASREALRWAAEEARVRGDYLVAVLAWAPAQVVAGPWPVAVPFVFDDDAEQSGKETLAALVREVLGYIPAVEVEQLVVPGPPAQALIEAARDAHMLVLGSRGYGGFAGLLLGSVSQQCAQHAPCPVVIVRAPGDASTPYERLKPGRS